MSYAPICTPCDLRGRIPRRPLGIVGADKPPVDSFYFGIGTSMLGYAIGRTMGKTKEQKTNYGVIGFLAGGAAGELVAVLINRVVR